MPCGMMAVLQWDNDPCAFGAWQSCDRVRTTGYEPRDDGLLRLRRTDNAFALSVSPVKMYLGYTYRKEISHVF
jgi:hypothetical protein